MADFGDDLALTRRRHKTSRIKWWIEPLTFEDAIRRMEPLVGTRVSVSAFNRTSPAHAESADDIGRIFCGVRGIFEHTQVTDDRAAVFGLRSDAGSTLVGAIELPSSATGEWQTLHIEPWSDPGPSIQLVPANGWGIEIQADNAIPRLGEPVPLLSSRRPGHRSQYDFVSVETECTVDLLNEFTGNGVAISTAVAAGGVDTAPTLTIRGVMDQVSTPRGRVVLSLWSVLLPEEPTEAVDSLVYPDGVVSMVRSSVVSTSVAIVEGDLLAIVLGFDDGLEVEITLLD